MTNITSTVLTHIIIFLMCFYTLSCFTVFLRDDERKTKRIYVRQNVLMFLIHFLAFLAMFLYTGEMRFIPFYLAQVVLFLATILLYNFLYPKVSRLIVNNMCMCIAIGLIMLSRLNFGLAVRQTIFAAIGVIFGLFVPMIIRKMHVLAKWRWIYALLGIGVLLFVYFFYFDTGMGARRTLAFGGLTVQPSEFLKIVFVFFVAATLKYSTSFKNILLSSVVAGAHILILVRSVDLGTSAIMFVVYVVMIFVATRKPLYALAGIAGGAGAAVVGYRLFGHVQVRVAAWQDPLAIFLEGGNQLSESLFGIGSGGWFGRGLFGGRPHFIPVVEEDFMFAAISEELGIIFGLALILVCVSCYVMFLNVAMDLRQPFYKLVALGLGTTYIFQVFLTIGGAIGFIPSTGVTLPLISYGGSSFLSTMIMFGIIQGLYIIREDEEELIENRKRDPYEEVAGARKAGKTPQARFKEI